MSLGKYLPTDTALYFSVVTLHLEVIGGMALLWRKSYDAGVTPGVPVTILDMWGTGVLLLKL